MTKTVTIFGATDKTGRQLITHAMAKGWHVRAFARNANEFIERELRSENFVAIKGYIFDEVDVLKAVTGADAILCSVGQSFDGTEKSRSLGMKNIIAQMEKAGVSRLVSVASRGILPDGYGGLVMDRKDFDVKYIPITLEYKQAYNYLKESTLDWTLVCVPPIILGDADNHFVTKSEKSVEGDHISAGNLALFMIQEVDRKEYVKKRVAIVDQEP